MIKFKTVKNNQSWLDLCLEVYGGLDNLFGLIELNTADVSIQPASGSLIQYDDSLGKDNSVTSSLNESGGSAGGFWTINDL